MFKWKVLISSSGGDQYPEARSPPLSSWWPCILVQVPWLQRWPLVWCTQAQMNMGTGMEGEAQHCPMGWVWQGMERDLVPVPRRGGDFIVTVKLMYIFNSLLNFSKVFAKMQRVKRIHVTPMCLSELWPCGTQSIRIFPWCLIIFKEGSSVLVFWDSVNNSQPNALTVSHRECFNYVSSVAPYSIKSCTKSLSAWHPSVAIWDKWPSLSRS